MKPTLLLFLAPALLGLTGCQKPVAGPPPVFPPTQVVAGEARRQPVTETLALVGTLAANELVEIKSEIEGVVQQINFDEGQPVEKGRLLVQLDESKLQASLAETEANFKLSKANHERSQQLFKDRLIAQSEFDQTAAVFEVNRVALDFKRRLLQDARVLAPFAGVMGSRTLSPGQVIKRDSTLAWLVDLNPVKVEVSVPERFLSEVKSGQKLEVVVAAFPGKKFSGEVYFIAPQLESASRTALVKARIPNPDLLLKPGMFATLEITLQIRSSAVVVPESALVMTGDRAAVFIVDAEQAAQIRPVKIGVRQAGFVEIASGLAGGEMVISEGVQKIGPGRKVKVVVPETTPAPATTNESGKVGERESGKGKSGSGAAN